MLISPKTLSAFSLVIAGLSLTPLTQAQDYSYANFTPNQQYYLGAMLGHSLHIEDSFEEFNVSAIGARLGYNFDKNYSVEVRYSKSIDKDDLGGYERELDSLYGIYGVASYPILKKVNIYGILGYTDAEISQYNNGFNTTSDNSGPAFGGGFEFVVNKRARWVAEMIVYVDDEVTYGAFTGGFRISF
ncbi:outer membrane beta-barrel protein [Thalassomonas sp. M1454]|uniref:outer membrane beta-barrel protein n=1 Tax=Thalassomonas sp. M1454 TaxID=2594477 RepID=UPI00117CAAFB|nr:outer membrane beta-barrel protein [Thalassomonas sp. M1454]TRX57159.1 porin family protein [Thalassomonas sp. M1454]